MPNYLTNIACDNLYGISIWVGYNNTLTGNTANSNTDGFTVGFGNNNTLTDNTANSNIDMGIYLRQSNSTRVTGNTLLGNDRCIVEEVCVDNLIENNDCGEEGVPGFTWSLVLLGFAGISLLAIALKRKEEL
jgi:parallel beta-helix repeat protein